MQNKSRAECAAISPQVLSNSLDRELWILTDVEKDRIATCSIGFSDDRSVRVDTWCQELHLKWLSVASVAVDVKAEDFRARHKPPAKAYDYLASGIPLITNRGSSPDLHLQEIGFQPLLAVCLWL